MINSGPRSDDSRPIPPHRTHEQRQLVNNYRATLARNFPKTQESDIERMIQHYRSEFLKINQYIESIVLAHRAGGKILDKSLLRSDVEKKYLELLAGVSKDELHLLMTAVLADLSIKNYM